MFILSSVNIASADDKADAKSALSSIEEELNNKMIKIRMEIPTIMKDFT